MDSPKRPPSMAMLVTVESSVSSLVRSFRGEPGTSCFDGIEIMFCRCTCPGESHPGPKHSDGTFVGRSAPEIDVLEAQVCLINNFPELSMNLDLF